MPIWTTRSDDFRPPQTPVRWGIVITVLNVVCWMYFFPIDGDKRVNQFLATREKILLQSRGFV